MAFFFWVCSRLTKDGIGGGDIKLVFVVTLFTSLELGVSLAFFGFIFAFFYSLYLVLFKKVDKKSSIPLVPSLYAGSAFVFILYILGGGN
jgi:prepilin signal peptidase PulO-like enzyme (type II secretory pathway)